MAMFGGFGGSASGGGVGLTLGTPKTTAPTLSFAAQPAATTGTSGGLSFSLAPKTTASTLSFNLAKTTAPTLGIAAATTTSGSGFSLGGPTLGGATLGGATLGGASTATLGGVPLGATTTAAAPSTGFSFGLTPASGATSTTTAAGLSLGTSTAASIGGLPGFGSTTSTAAPTLGFGGGGLLGAASTTGGSIFSSVTTPATVTGLGGVDPKTCAAGAGVSGSTGSSADGKLLKENFIPDPLVVTVDELQKYVKDEKSVREDIVRMSSKPMMRVSEDIAALKQLLSVVSNGLQRNACTLDKLKTEMTQELKNAEMAQRTKDIPPGLQYENTAPTEYFEQVLDQFENRMIAYRQQIEMLENHLATLHQPLRHSPAELFELIRKLHETFIALAAQLQQVHEKIKNQKEQFLTYRRVFHGDTKDIFQRAALVSAPPAQRRPLDTSGPTPFPGITNPAAAAMASVMSRSQQHHGPPVAGLLGSGATSWLTAGGSGLGSTGLLSSGTSLLGQPVTQATSQGLASSSMFSLGSGLGAAGAANSNNSSLASTLGSLNNTANSAQTLSAATKQPFTLQKPPQGAKRGKR